MTLYYKNAAVIWQGAGWYILRSNSNLPKWANEWQKAETLEELDAAAKIDRRYTAYITKNICDKIE